MENKNTLIALSLMLVVWVGFSFFSQHQTPVPDVSSSSDVKESGPNTDISSSPAVSTVPAQNSITPSTTYVEERDITVDTAKFTAVLSNSGGRIKSFVLKNYRQKAGKNSPLIDIVNDTTGGIPTLISTGSGNFQIDPNALYVPNIAESNISISEGEFKDISFSYQNADGIRIVKTFRFSGNGYDIPLRITVDNTRDNRQTGQIQLGLVTPWENIEKSSRLSYFGPATLSQDKVHTEKSKNLGKQGVVYDVDVKWTAIEDEYFMTAIVPLNMTGEKISIQKNGTLLENKIESPQKTIDGLQGISFEYLVYMGPRDLDILKGVDHDLSKIIDFGFFDFIARPLLHVLKFFYSYVGNYGVAIILLTVIIKLLFWPLTQKSYASMKAMQTLQPEMQKIREKYKNDKERLNREIMELYKTKRVNPLGGCLPMLIQIPVFFALYKVLLGNIALRHAPFAFWLTDLSAKDPYYITPVIMGVTMFLQQKMSPSTMDPTQAKMFMLMPVVFTFLFLNFPSGLVIYWLVNNVLTIFQQYLINKGHKTKVHG